MSKKNDIKRKKKKRRFGDNKPLLQCITCKQKHFKMMKCSVCKIAFYCSVDCQRGDYKKHKLLCKPISSGTEEILKRFRSIWVSLSKDNIGVDHKEAIKTFCRKIKEEGKKIMKIELYDRSVDVYGVTGAGNNEKFEGYASEINFEEATEAMKKDWGKNPYFKIEYILYYSIGDVGNYLYGSGSKYELKCTKLTSHLDWFSLLRISKK